MKYVENQFVEMFGSDYLVQRVYQLSDDEMKRYDLVHRNRVTLKKISGKNGLDHYDFAIPEEGS